jgi:hypothetical protein
MYVYLPNMNALRTFNNREVVLPPIQDVLGISKQMTFPFQYSVTSKLVNLPKLIHSAIQISDILVLSVRCKLSDVLYFSVLIF